MSDYSAHDIHRLDQAYPDALASIEHLTGDPTRKRRLTDAGPEVFAAELTHELAATFTNPMSLAGWAAIATARLMEAEKTWEEDTELAYEQRDAARAMADELRAELGRVRPDVSAMRGELNRMYAADMAKLRAELVAARDMANTARAETRNLMRALDQARAVVEAAKAWRAQFSKPADTKLPRQRALIEAVDALPKPAEVA